jgi:GPI ethanolamine phosphate transferase 1
VAASLLPFIFPVKHSNPSSKILTFFLAFTVCFVILSISVEGLFYLAYSAAVTLWIEVEAVLRNASTVALTKGKGKEKERVRYQPRADDLRIALFFLFFNQVAFFGTGK